MSENSTNDKLLDFIEAFKDEFKVLPFEEIAFPRGCNNLVKYSDSVTLHKKGCPVQVRGALSYNRQLIENKLNRFMPVQEGDKVKFCYLLVPNPTMQNVIATPATLPRELQLEQYFDHKTQFQKAFLNPISTITVAIGWQCERTQTLEEFFG